MKMVKKVLLGLAAAAAVLALTGCADELGEGKASGSKYNKTITVETETLDDAYTFRRYIKELSSSEKVAEITTTITFDTEDSVLYTGDEATPTTAAVVGFAFDLNKSWDGENDKATSDTGSSKLRDFVLFGFQPTKRRAYVEHYSNVNFKEEFDGDATSSAIGTADAFIFPTNSNDGWKTVTEGTHYTLEDGVYTLEVSVKQKTEGTYTIYLGGQELGTYEASGNFTDDIGSGSNKKTYAVGGVAGYVNCPKGTKVVANYATDKDDVTGKLFEEVEE